MDKKPQYDMSSSNALQSAERPKSAALPIIPKPSLNADVEAWVRSGGKVQVVAPTVRKDLPVAESRKQRAKRNGSQV
jgi:hypothetical protein